MILINLIKTLLGRPIKNQNNQIMDENIYLDKWERLKQLPDPYLGDIFIEAKTEDIAVALVHCDIKTRNRFIEFSKSYKNHKYLSEFINKYSNVSKNASDKMKAIISNLSGLNRVGYIQTTH